MINNGRVVLIIDDSPSIRRQVCMVLNKTGIEVREAGSEFGMFNAVEQYGKMAEVIIMDLTLKNEHGFNLIAKLKASPKFMNIPILILTEHADAQNVLSAKKLGVQGYLRKPIDAGELNERVSALLKK